MSYSASLRSNFFINNTIIGAQMKFLIKTRFVSFLKVLHNRKPILTFLFEEQYMNDIMLMIYLEVQMNNNFDYSLFTNLYEVDFVSIKFSAHEKDRDYNVFHNLLPNIQFRFAARSRHCYIVPRL